MYTSSGSLFGFYRLRPLFSSSPDRMKWNQEKRNKCRKLLLETHKESDYERNHFLVEDAPEGGFTAKSLGYSIYTDADTVAELHANVRDAVACHSEETKRFRLSWMQS